MDVKSKYNDVDSMLVNGDGDTRFQGLLLEDIHLLHSLKLFLFASSLVIFSGEKLLRVLSNKNVRTQKGEWFFSFFDNKLSPFSTLFNSLSEKDCSLSSILKFHI